MDHCYINKLSIKPDVRHWQLEGAQNYAAGNQAGPRYYKALDPAGRDISMCVFALRWLPC